MVQSHLPWSLVYDISCNIGPSFVSLNCKENLISLKRVNPFMPNGISYLYQLYQSISILRDVGRYLSFSFKF